MWTLHDGNYSRQTFHPMCNAYRNGFFCSLDLLYGLFRGYWRTNSWYLLCIVGTEWVLISRCIAWYGWHSSQLVLGKIYGCSYGSFLFQYQLWRLLRNGSLLHSDFRCWCSLAVHDNDNLFHNGIDCVKLCYIRTRATPSKICNSASRYKSGKLGYT